MPRTESPPILDHLDPDKPTYLECQQLPGDLSIYEDETCVFSLIVNAVVDKLAPKTAKRARVVIYEDRIITTGFWTPEEAVGVTDRITLNGTNGNLGDPRPGFLQRIYPILAAACYLGQPVIGPLVLKILGEEEIEEDPTSPSSATLPPGDRS